MIFGMTTATYTFVHIVISLVGIFSGFVVVFGLSLRNDSTVGQRSFWRLLLRRA